MPMQLFCIAGPKLSNLPTPKLLDVNLEPACFNISLVAILQQVTNINPHVL